MAALLLKEGIPMVFSSRTERGFSLIELMLVVAMLGTLIAMALPVMKDMTASAKLSESTRFVERELQGARLKAVSVNRSLRVRLNCPAVGYIRRVELLGSMADSGTNRCLGTAYPFPADTDLTTRPNFDGPVLIIPNGATVTGVDLQFNPDGTTSQVVNNVTQAIDTVTLRVTRQSKSRTVTVNGAGKIQYQQ
jgi:prepilin-type N-terminal cleavage/methylation domain-containing protein